jgi:succinoglycan biosynthesis protein ExoW
MRDNEALPCEKYEFSVIVPFFQRERGILARAVISALKQEGVAMPRVIVVDDGSPISAETELRSLLEDHPEHLIILRQKNQGPGSARNRGIEYARRDSQYIAFLDSDDFWASTHLATAKQALDSGFDFYFCNARHRDGMTTVFETKDFPKPSSSLLSAEHHIFEYRGDLFEIILVGCPIVTPAVVYRASVFPLLFRTDLRTAGEDYFFWLEIASRRKKTAFCTTPNVNLGYGINIYIGAKWGSPEQLWQIFYNLTYSKDAERYLAASGSYRQAFRRRIRVYRQQFIDSTLSGLIEGQRSSVFSIARKFLFMDPLTIFWIPPIVARKVYWRLRKSGIK